MEYEYFLTTADKKGSIIDTRRIAGLFSDNTTILRMVATTDNDWIIYIIIGETTADDAIFDPKSTKAFNIELLADGKIIES